MSLSSWLKEIPEACYVWIFKKPLARFLPKGCETKEGDAAVEERFSCDLKAGKQKITLQGGEG